MKGVAAVIAPMLLSVSSAVLAGPSPGPGPAPHGSPQAAADAWGSIRFLVGDWVGEGSGKPGQGRGSFSFRFDLEQKILVRRNHSEYPAAGEKPAIVHDHLMVCYPDPAGAESSRSTSTTKGTSSTTWPSRMGPGAWSWSASRGHPHPVSG